MIAAALHNFFPSFKELFPATVAVCPFVFSNHLRDRLFLFLSGHFREPLFSIFVRDSLPAFLPYLASPFWDCKGRKLFDICKTFFYLFSFRRFRFFFPIYSSKTVSLTPYPGFSKTPSPTFLRTPASFLAGCKDEKNFLILQVKNSLFLIYFFLPKPSNNNALFLKRIQMYADFAFPCKQNFK